MGTGDEFHTNIDFFGYKLQTLYVYFIFNAFWLVVLLIEVVIFFSFYRTRPWIEKLNERSRFSFWVKCFSVLRILSIPILFFIDMSSDIFFIIDIYNDNSEGNSMYCLYVLVIILVNHALLSAYITFNRSKSKNRWAYTLAELFDVRILYEVFLSLRLGRSTYELREIRLLEAMLESCPQLIVQIHYLILWVDPDIREWSAISYVSIATSILSIAQLVNHFDVLSIQHNKRGGRWLRYIFSHLVFTVWRFAEIMMRVGMVAVYTFVTAWGIIVYCAGMVIFIFSLRYYQVWIGFLQKKSQIRSASSWYDQLLRMSVVSIKFDPMDLVTGQHINVKRHKKSLTPDQNYGDLLLDPHFTYRESISMFSEFDEFEAPEDSSRRTSRAETLVLEEEEAAKCVSRETAEMLGEMFQLTLLHMVALELNNRGVNRFINAVKCLELVAGSVIIYTWWWDEDVCLLFLVVPTIVFLVCFLLLCRMRHWGFLDMKIYFSALDEDVDALFEIKNTAMIIRLIERKEIRELNARQHRGIRIPLPLRELAEQRFSIKEVARLGYKDEEIIQHYSLRKLRRAKFDVLDIRRCRTDNPSLQDFLDAGFEDIEQIQRAGFGDEELMAVGIPLRHILKEITIVTPEEMEAYLSEGEDLSEAFEKAYLTPC